MGLKEQALRDVFSGAVGEGLMSDDPLVRAEAKAALDENQLREDFHAAKTGVPNGRNVDRFLTSEERQERADLVAGGGDSRRSRAERLQLILMVIANERLAERLRETYKAFDDIRERVRELLERIERLLEQARRDYQDLMNNAALHPATGERILRFEDGHVETEDGRLMPPEEVQDVDFTGRTRGEARNAGSSWVLDLEQKKDRLLGIDRSAEAGQERMTDPNLTQEQRDKIEAEERRNADGLRKELEEIEKSHSADLQKSAIVNASPDPSLDALVGQGAIAMPQLP